MYGRVLGGISRSWLRQGRLQKARFIILSYLIRRHTRDVWWPQNIASTCRLWVTAGFVTSGLSVLRVATHFACNIFATTLALLGGVSVSPIFVYGRNEEMARTKNAAVCVLGSFPVCAPNDINGGRDTFFHFRSFCVQLGGFIGSEHVGLESWSEATETGNRKCLSRKLINESFLSPAFTVFMKRKCWEQRL